MDAYLDYLIHKFDTDGIVEYPRVLPKGIDIKGQGAVPEITGRMLSFGSAKTRYENLQTLCRAEDIDTLKGCCACQKRKDCIPQMRLDIAHWSGILRFYLSGVALLNFMLFLSAMHHKGINPLSRTITITVFNRGRWGELRFTPAPINL